MSSWPTQSEIAKFYSHFYINESSESFINRVLRRLRSFSERARARSLVTYAMRQVVKLGRQGSLVDFGSGNGMLTRALRDVGGTGSHIISVDSASDVLALIGIANETWCVGEQELIEHLKKTNLRFGAVFFSHTLEHFVDPTAVLREVSARLVDDGRIFVDCPSGLHPSYFHGSDLNIPDFVFFTPDGVRAIARLTGHKVLDLQGISPGPSYLYQPPDSVLLQYLASCAFLTRSILTGDGYFTGGNPLWLRFTLARVSGSLQTH